MFIATIDFKLDKEEREEEEVVNLKQCKKCLPFFECWLIP